MPAVAPRAAVDLHELTHGLQIARKRHDHDAIAVSACRNKGFRGHHCGDPDWWMRLLNRSRHETHVTKLTEFSFMGDPLLIPKPGDNVDPLFEAGSAFVHVNAENIELLRNKSAPKTSVETAVAEVAALPVRPKP